MKSGIFAVVTIGDYRLYVGEVHHLKSRWRSLLAQLENNQYPDSYLQRAWNIAGGKRRFTFHTTSDLLKDTLLTERHRFLADAEITPGSLV